MQHFTLFFLFLCSICLQTAAFLASPPVQRQLQLSLATAVAPKAFRPSKGRRTASRAPPRLPSGAFAPKQSLGQNFLSDAHYAERIVDQVDEKREGALNYTRAALVCLFVCLLIKVMNLMCDLYDFIG